MTQVFLSHATADDALVRLLQQALALQGVDLWIDSRKIVGGDPLLKHYQGDVWSSTDGANWMRVSSESNVPLGRSLGAVYNDRIWSVAPFYFACPDDAFTVPTVESSGDGYTWTPEAPLPAGRRER